MIGDVGEDVERGKEGEEGEMVDEDDDEDVNAEAVPLLLARGGRLFGL